MVTHNHGWASLVKRLNTDLGRVSPGLSLSIATENHVGLPVFSYDNEGLSDQQKDLANKIIGRAELVAQETCVECGKYARLWYDAETRQARVYCGKHHPKGWTAL